MSPDQLQTSLRDLTIILFKRKWSIVTIILATMLGSVVYLFLMRGDVYQVTAQILVKLGQEQAAPPTMIGKRVNIVVQLDHAVNAEIAILQSTQLIEKLVDHLQLDKPPPKRLRPPGWLGGLRYDVKALVKQLKQWKTDLKIYLGLQEKLTPREQMVALLDGALHVEAAHRSNVVVATLYVPIRQGSSTILNTLLDLYLTFRPKIYQDPSAVDFFKDQVRGSLERLEKSQRALHEFETATDIIPLEEQRSIILREIARARAAFQTATLEVEDAASKVANLERELTKSEPDFAALGEFGPNSFPESIQRQLTDLQREREQMRMIELDDGIRIRNNRDQFTALMSVLSSHLRSVFSHKTEMLKSRKRPLDSLKRSLKALHDEAVTWRSLVRQVELDEQDYRFHKTKLQESTAVSGARGGQRGQCGGDSACHRPRVQGGHGQDEASGDRDRVCTPRGRCLGRPGRVL